MPNLEAELADFAGRNVLRQWTFCNACCQFSVDAASYDACVLISPQGVFTSERVLHVLKNAAAHFQAHLLQLFQSIQNAFKSCLDDVTIYAKERDELMEHLDAILASCNEYNTKLSAAKGKVFQTKVKWCWRIINASRYQLELRNIKVKRSMDCTSTANELGQFIHRCRWMSSCIPNLHSISQPLSDILEEAYVLCGKRRKASFKKVALHKLSCGAILKAAFTNLKETLKSSVNLAHSKEAGVISVFTDTSDNFWAGIATQMQQSEMRTELEKHQHQL